MKDPRTEMLKDYFRQRNMTQKDIGEKLGITQVAVSKLMNGMRFTLKTAKAWNEAFGLSTTWLLTGDGEMLDTGGSVTQNVEGDGNQVAGGNISTECSKDISDALEIIKQQQQDLHELIMIIKHNAWKG